MASTPVPETGPATPQHPRSRGTPPEGLHSWLLARLDSLLSKELREASALDLVRSRVLVGAAGFMLLFDLLALGLMPLPATKGLLALLALGYLGTLVLARGATSPTLPALLLCSTMAMGFAVAGLTVSDFPYIGTHSAHMLLPALAVYLMRPRLGLVLTLFLIATQTVLQPLLHTHQQLSLTPYYWPLHISSAVSFLGAWGLSALQNTARDAAQASLERTLKTLRESEGRLQSLIESTDDQICSLDREGRMLTANTAMRQAYLTRTGAGLALGQPLFAGGSPEWETRWNARLAPVLAGQHVRFEEEKDGGEARTTMDVHIHPILGEGGVVTGMTIFSRDITARKEAEARLGEMHRTLVDISRQAGMAEIATGVLHNVGNTLNSVNVSTSLVIDLLRKSRLAGLLKTADLLRQHTPALGTFLTTDPQGQKLPAYLITLAGQLQHEHDRLLQEMHSLRTSVEHINAIVSMQQKHARTSGAVESIQVPQLIDEALRLHAVSLERMGIRIERDYTDMPPIVIDRHKLLQILVNLLNNAQQALVESGRQDKRLSIRARMADGGVRLRIEVTDNGVGIAPENMSRMFTQGFTTKKDGHGFGLHISALAATEMKGRLTCASPGLQQGTTFTLELPTAADLQVSSFSSSDAGRGR